MDEDGWTKVEYKKKHPVKNKATSDETNYGTGMFVDHQQWGRTILKGGSYQKKKPNPDIDNTVAKGVSNKQHVNHTNINKIEKKIDEGDLSHRKISQNLRLAIQKGRTEKKWTQDELAKHSQVPINDIRNYEKGVGIPDPQIVQKIGRALDIKLSIHM